MTMYTPRRCWDAHNKDNGSHLHTAGHKFRIHHPRTSRYQTQVRIALLHCMAHVAMLLNARWIRLQKLWACALTLVHMQPIV